MTITPLYVRGLAELIAMEPDMEVCGEAADMAEAIKQIEANCPDVAILDISLKSGHGLELIEHIKANHPGVKMLVSSMHDELLFAERSLRAGALGYIPKQEATETLLDAIRQVLRGEIYLTRGCPQPPDAQSCRQTCRDGSHQYSFQP